MSIIFRREALGSLLPAKVFPAGVGAIPGTTGGSRSREEPGDEGRFEEGHGHPEDHAARHLAGLQSLRSTPDQFSELRRIIDAPWAEYVRY